MERVAGEAGGVAEGVEDVAAPGQNAGTSAVLALVEVGTGLVADADRHLEGDAAFVHPDAPRPGATGPPEGRREPFEPSGSLLVHVEDERVTEHVGQNGGDRRTGAHHPQGETLNHE